MSELILVPGRLTLEQLQAIHGGGVRLALDDSARPAIRASAEVVARAAAGDAPVYGVNTGFGKLASTRIDAAALERLQLNLIRSHSVGVGEAMSPAVVRLLLALKAASLARGASGVRQAVVDTLLAVFNAGLLPWVPSQGSVGASGDLAPLAHMTLALIGEGEFWVDGQRRPAHAALSAAGIAPLALAAKEGLALINGTQAMAALEKLKASSYSIVKREDKPTSSKPSAPFITSTLQQAASNRLGFGVKKTMMMAQRLYEAGYITYMRTDSTNLSVDAVTMARTYIEGEFGKKYLPENPNVYSSKEGAQEAHEAIRPSDANTEPSKLSGMERDAERLYELIWRQFLACQMLPAQYLSTTVTVGAGDFELRAKGRILKFDGYTRVMPQIAKPGDDDVLPDMAQGDAMKLIKLDPTQHFTKPPARYSEASLVKEMEKRGIGRPSTYAAIISTIQDRGYVALHNRRFYSEKMGDIVTERLAESFSNLMDYGFTAGMEENLDDVAQGERDWKNVLDEFYGDFKKKLEVAESAEGGMCANQPVMTDIPCVLCGRPMQIRTASTGVFLGCSGYSLPPKERCKATVNLVPGDEIAADDEGESESLVLRGKHRCPICSTAMDAYLLDEKRKLHICGNNPDCSGYEIEEGTYRIKGYEGPSLECDKCGSEMQLKTGRFGKFFGCTNATCKNTRKLLKSGDAAPPKMDPVKMPELKCEKVNDTYILRDGASGLFLAASQFPKNRETRAPLVKELIPHKDEIDPKYHFLLSAPQKDPEGRPAVIRFSRKTKEQYVQTEIEGKPTGWKAFFDGGKWKVEDKSTK